MLSVHDPRARGSSRSRERSRSRGGSPPRSRSRDIRAPSPARASSPPRSSKSGRSKKFYDPESEESEAITESESEDDRRSSRRGKRDEYESRPSRRNESPSEEEYSEDESRGHRAVKSEKEREYETRYQRAGEYRYARPDEYTQRMSYVKPRQDDMAYGDYSDHPSQPRHMSINTAGGFRMDVGRDKPHVYHQDAAPYSPDRPPYAMNVAGGRPQYQQPEQYKYAQPSPYLKYVPKNQPGPHYVQTPETQIEVAHRRTRREEDEARHVPRRYEEDKKEKEKKKKSRHDDSDDDRRKKKYRDESDDDKRKKKYRDDPDDDKREKKYKDDSDNERKKKKKKKSHRDSSDDDKSKKKYKDESDDDKRKKKYRDDSDGDRKKSKSKRHSDSDDDDDDDDNDRRKPARRDSDHKSKSSRPHRDSEPPRMVEIHPGGTGGPAGHAGAALAPNNLNSRMHRLSVSGQAPGALTLMAPGGHNAHHAGALPPGSPLLEAYHGTYQSISPMPSPMALPSTLDEGLSDVEPLDNGSDSDGLARNPKSILKKRVEIYDPEPDALAIAAELKHTKPGAEPLVKILPLLSDDNIMALRTEYKKHFKVNGKGINIAKHIKLKVTGNIGKAAYATALGRWESEAYWSNFWYQSNTSRRELLIESLIGRSNLEIRKIKEAFSDKRYGDSLEKCMQAELKKDKFRHAVLVALEERRQDELEKLSMPRIERDAVELYKALVSKDGGETAMIDIIVVRSDSHLRQVLQEFERRYKANFAREMIKKSQNLVGETLAHILNGVLNRPVRDALLLHQAINETAKDRAELLVSRLVRMHWEPKHLERVKMEFKRKYGKSLEKEVQEGTKGDFGDFCVSLCGGAVR